MKKNARAAPTPTTAVIEGGAPPDKPYLTTTEAARYCGFKTGGGMRRAKLDGRVFPVGRRFGSSILMWRREDLDRFLQGWSSPGFVDIPGSVIAAGGVIHGKT